MSHAWERQTEISQKDKSQPSIQDDYLQEDKEKLNLGSMIKNIDNRDEWWNTLPDWVGFKNGGFNQNTERTESLKVMAPKMSEWGDVTIGDLKKYYFDKTATSEWKTGSSVGKLLADEKTQAMSKDAVNTIRYFVEELEL